MELLGWKNNGVVYWIGNLESLLDVYELDFKDLVYLGNDPEMKYLTGQISLEEWLKLEGFNVEIRDGKIIASNKKEAKRLAKFFRDRYYPDDDIYYYLGEEEEAVKLNGNGMGIAAAIMVGLTIMATAGLVWLLTTSEEVKELKIKRGYGFVGDSKSPTQIIDFDFKIDYHYPFGVPLATPPCWLALKNETSTIYLFKIEQPGGFHVRLLVNQTNYSVNGEKFEGHLHGTYAVIIGGHKEFKKYIEILPPPEFRGISKIRDKVLLEFYSEDKTFVENGKFHLILGNNSASFLLNGIGEVYNQSPEIMSFLNETEVIEDGKYIIWRFPTSDLEIVLKTYEPYPGFEAERKIYPA